jgi:lipopolysaccharide export system permease protein
LKLIKVKKIVFGDGMTKNRNQWLAAAPANRPRRNNLVNRGVPPEYPRMRLLDRYLLRELLVPLAFCLGGFLIFYVAFDLIFGIKGFLEKQLTPGDIAEYYLATLPELLVMQVIPVSLLLALLYALTNHNRYQELTAMRAAGVGLWRMSLP